MRHDGGLAVPNPFPNAPPTTGRRQVRWPGGRPVAAGPRSEDGHTDEEVLGDATSYTYQLARVADVIWAGAPYPSDVNGSIVTADLMDECYRRAGLTPRAL